MIAAAAALAVDPVRVLAERDRILAAREFNPAPDWRTRLLDWFADRFEGLTSLMPFGLGAFGLLLLLLALAVALVWLLPAGGRPGGGARVAPAPAVERARGFAALQADARRALAGGQLAEAVRFSWLAALAMLDEAGISSARASRADWEHVAATRRQRPDLAETLAGLAIEFQRTRFGRIALVPAQADRCLALLGTLERDLRG